MTFPFESLSGEHRALGLAIGVLLGIAFGFVLERSGLGRVQKLVGQFYGKDMTVLKVMFTAIVTAMVGLAILSGVGVLDLDLIQLRYPTYLWPMIVGGVVLGAGFVMSGYCPGTSFVAGASGKLDGVATIAGIVAGSLVYAETQPLLRGFETSGRLGTFTLATWLGLPAGLVAGLAVVLAVAAFALAERIEAWLRAPEAEAPPSLLAPPSEPELAMPARKR